MDVKPYSSLNFEFAEVIEASLSALACNVAAAKNIPIDSHGCEYIVKLVLGVQRACGCTLVDRGDPKATSSAVTAIIRVLEEVAASNRRSRGSEPNPAQSGQTAGEALT